LERRKAFDPLLQDLSTTVGKYVKSGPLENRGWMRVWFENKNEMISQEKIAMYIDQYSKFIAATFPVLVKLYE